MRREPGEISLRFASAFALALVLVLSPFASRADGITREAALHALLLKVDLPLSRQVFARMMASMSANAPGTFVDGIGRTGQLGPEWKAGNPQWDRAQALVAARLAREESSGGPVFAVTRLDVERALDLPWTEDDIRFIDQSLSTPLGQTLQRLLDAGIVAGFVESIERDGGVTDDMRGPFDDALKRSHTQYDDAIGAVDRLSADDPQRAERLRRLLATEDAQAMQQIGAALFRPSVRRFSSLAADVAPQVEQLAAEFRAHR